MDAITAEEALDILRTLGTSDGEVRRRIVEEARRRLIEAPVDAEEIAESVLLDLGGIEVEDLWDRSGPSRHGYTGPAAAAVDMVEEALEFYADDIERLGRLGARESSLGTLMGVVKGLYRFDKESKTEFRDWAEDIAADVAWSLAEKWRKTATDRERQAWKNFLARHCPDWAE